MAIHILGISAFYHDAAAALLSDDQIIAAAQEERFTRKKHDSGFPSNAIKFCLTQSGLPLREIDAIVFYDKPFLKFERLLETYYVYAPKGLRSFLSSMPIWIKEKLFLKNILVRELSKIDTFDKAKTRLLFSEHHLSHAASAFFPSPFKEAAIITVDGVGEWATASIASGKDGSITIHKELRFPHSLGLLYSAFTYYLGFKVNSGEYKLMGLSPYGNPASERVTKYKKIILDNLLTIKEDGSIWLNQALFSYASDLKMVNDEKWETLFGFARRMPEAPIEQCHCDCALAIQHITEEIIIKIAKTARELTGAKHLCLAGGVALNCVANAMLLKEGLFEDIWIQPAAGDAGGALGAAYAAYHIYFRNEKASSGRDQMQGSCLGPEFSDLDIIMTARKHKAPFTHFDDFGDLCEATAGFLSEGNVIGWFQDRMEWGPRALGNRSILGDARDKSMQKRLNLKIKFRESFRPFAPAVPYEDVRDYFELDRPSPYMLLVSEVAEKRRIPLPENYHLLPLREKLYFNRSDIPAVTHLDYTARVQTVHRETNPKFWNLLHSFKRKTGCSVLVNTSFNVRGEPIVCTPEDAYQCFMRTDIDYLIMGNLLFDKKAQPVWREAKDWRDEYEAD